jgi:predicted transcriptional regulator
MSISSESIDYYDKLILYYLLNTDLLPNQTEISEKTQINYRTVILKIQKLERLDLIQTDSKGRQKIVSISAKGQHFIEEWQQTNIGEKTIAEYNKILEK